MPTPHSLAALVSSLAVAALIAPAPARACMPPPAYVDLAGETVPIAGPIAVEVTCNIKCDGAKLSLDVIALTLTGEGDPIPGTTSAYPSARGYYLVFQPDAPLTDGDFYRATLSGVGPDPGPYVAVMAEDRAGPEATGDDIVAGMDVSLVRAAEPVGTRYCCSRGPCGGGRCYTERERVQALLVASVPAELTQQVRFLTRLVPDDGNAGPYGHPSASLVRTEAAERYCATLEALSLVDGTVTTRKVCAAPESDMPVGQVVDASYTADDVSCDAAPVARDESGLSDHQADPAPENIVEPFCDGKRSACEDDACLESLPKPCGIHTEASGCTLTHRRASPSAALLLLSLCGALYLRPGTRSPSIT